MEEIGRTIAERRRELGLSQQEVAALSGVGINTLVAIEGGKGNPSFKTLSRVAGVLGFGLRLV